MTKLTRVQALSPEVTFSACAGLTPQRSLALAQRRDDRHTRRRRTNERSTAREVSVSPIAGPATA